tara:strand:+ start:35 stop:337 length:303 start_codon:yes stop_codon:yes gene_type:complete
LGHWKPVHQPVATHQRQETPIGLSSPASSANSARAASRTSVYRRSHHLNQYDLEQNSEHFGKTKGNEIIQPVSQFQQQCLWVGVHGSKLRTFHQEYEEPV